MSRPVSDMAESPLPLYDRPSRIRTHLMPRVSLRVAATSRRLTYIAVAVGIYIIFPVIHLPFVPISLSALLLAWLAFEVLRQSRAFAWQDHAVLISISGVYASALLLSLVGNVLVSSDPVTVFTVLLGMRLPFWVGVMVLIAVVFSQTPRPREYVRVLGWAAMGLGAVRVFSALTGGGQSGISTFGMSQNVVGFIFSSFWPFALAVSLEGSGRTGRVFTVLGVSVLGLAVIVNGSRSSWVAIAVTTALFFLALVAMGRQRFRMGVYALAVGCLVSAAVGLGITSVLPDNVRSALELRAQTFGDLEMDTSYQTRVAMRYKAIALFRRNPLLGVGPGRFTEVTTEFDVPSRLKGRASAEELNERSAHSAYYQHLAETGVIGTTTLAILLGFLSYRGAMAALRLLAVGLVWPLGIFLGFVGMSVHLFTVSALLGTQPWLVYGLLGGLIVWERRYSAWLGTRPPAAARDWKPRRRWGAGKPARLGANG